MTAALTIATDTVVYSVVPDATIERVAFVTGSLVDEATGKPVENAAVRADRTSIVARVVAGGYFAASGMIERVFPDHATTGSSTTLTFTAPRYRPRTVIVPIGAGVLFPVIAGAVFLRPLPVRVAGRVAKESDRTGIAGATVAPKAGTAAVLLRTTAHADHASGLNVTPVTIADAGPVRAVDVAIKGGASVVTLDNVGGLAANDILRFGAVPSEYAIVDSVDAGAVTVTLRYALTRSYAKGAAVQSVTAIPLPGATATTRSIDAGDGLLLLTAALAASAVEISDPPLLEYHDVNAIADADGFFTADGIGGVGVLTLSASALGFAPLDYEWIIDYSRPVAALSFRLKP
jgi:hypothetical protein